MSVFREKKNDEFDLVSRSRVSTSNTHFFLNGGNVFHLLSAFPAETYVMEREREQPLAVCVCAIALQTHTHLPRDETETHEMRR